jgi:hypothetical protein
MSHHHVTCQLSHVSECRVCPLMTAAVCPKCENALRSKLSVPSVARAFWLIGVLFAHVGHCGVGSSLGCWIVEFHAMEEKKPRNAQTER